MKHRLNYAEIYITNACNLSCTHCQSLNNFSFKGHQLWKDHKDEYTALSKRISIDRVQIIGGEPTLNPDFETWVNEISNLWPEAKIEISTNGARLDKLNYTIYDILSRNKGTLWFTCHDIELYDNMLKFSKQFLDDIVDEYTPKEYSQENWKISYDSVRQDSWPDCDQIEQFSSLPENIKKQFTEIHRSNSTFNLKTVSKMLVDKNGVEVRLDWSQTFESSAIKAIDQQRLTMKYHSDPIKAHENCHFKTCHQINKGKLYKCPLVSVLPDFLNQFDVEIDDDDRRLANSYSSLTSTDDDTTIKNFIDNIDQPIPQCKFCPIDHKKHHFVGTDKKIKIIPLQ